MNESLNQIQAAMAALQAQRATLGDAVVDNALAGLREAAAALQRPDDVRRLKQVAVLFLDIVGSTTLSQRLDPEDIQAVMDGALKRFGAIVEAHLGRVLQHAGDSLLAAFGADAGREDDAERAVHAGLALLQQGRREAEQVRQRHAHEGFDVRVGIHTGPVLLGGGVDAEGTVRGMTVNIAARMEQTAPPGMLRISHDTYRHVRADAGSLDFIDHLAAACPDLPMLVLCGTRPMLYERRPHWDAGPAGADADGAPPRARITLEPLPAARVGELADALLQRIDDPPPALRELLTRHAEGNPFYMEELANMLIDDGVIETHGERWKVASERLPGLRVPSTLASVLQARLDALPPAEREALRRAGVIGHVFWDEALACLQAGAAEALPPLARKDLIHDHPGSAFAGTNEYAFKHHLLHQVTYDNVLKQHKREQHRLVAEWLIRRSGERAGEYQDLIAEHFERAGDTAQAARWWRAAAEGAERRFAPQAVLAHCARALALTEPADLERRHALAILRARALATQPSRDDWSAALDELEALADALGEDGQRSFAACLRSHFLINGGRADEALVVARSAMAWAHGRPLEGARASDALATALTRLGRYAAAREHVEAGLVLAEDCGDRGLRATLLGNAGTIEADTGNLLAAADLYRQSAAGYRAIGDRFGESQVLGNLAEMSRALGDYDEARAQMLATLALCDDVDNRRSAGFARLNLALVLVNQGLPEEALAHAHAALNFAREAGDRWTEAMAHRNAGHAELALGRPAAAAGHHASACALCDALHIGHMAIEPMAGLAAAALAGGGIGQAVQHVQAILDRIAAGATLDGLDEPLRMRLTCYRVLVAAGDPRAAGMLAIAHAELQALARKVGDPQKRLGLLHNVPYHHEIVVAWQAAQIG